jgi:hypothetical protein
MALEAASLAQRCLQHLGGETTLLRIMGAGMQLEAAYNAAFQTALGAGKFREVVPNNCVHLPAAPLLAT